MAIKRNSRRGLLLASTATMFSTGISLSLISLFGFLVAGIWATASFANQTDGVTAITPLVLLGFSAIPTALILVGAMSVGVTMVSIKAAVSPGQRRAPGIVLGLTAVFAYPVAALILLALDKSAAVVVALPAVFLLASSPWWGPLAATNALPRRTTQILISTVLVSAFLALVLQAF